MHAPQTKATPRRTIHFWLNCLVVACVVPAVLVTTFIIYRSFTQERSSLERDLVGTARALTQAVDAELNGARSALLVLAMSPYLTSGDLAKFYDEAQRVVPTIGIDNVVLSDSDGQQLLNTLRPFGTPLPMHGNPQQMRRAFEKMQPVVSDIFIGGVTKRPLIAIDVPVLAGGNPRHYELAVGIFPERLSEILRRQKTPPDWAVGIVDSSQTIVARSIGGEESIGKKVTAALSLALKERNEGTFEGETLEGVPVLTGFSRSSVSEWTVAIGVPKEGLFGFVRQALVSNVAAAFGLMIVGIILARLISARIGASISSLREPASRLGLPEPLVVPPINIQEVEDLGRSLVGAHALIEQRTSERDDLRRRIMSAQEEERLRLAHDLHDQTGQSVSAAILELKGLERLVDDKARGRVRFLSDQLDELGQMLHRIAWELRPASIDELGLTHALESYLAEWSNKHGIKADFHCSDRALDKRSNEVRTTIYRIVQEGLTNVARHASDATHVSVVIGVQDSTLHLMIEDDGKGFDQTVLSSRLGLAGMRERLLLVGGVLQIESAAITGTTIYARIPVLAGRSAA